MAAPRVDGSGAPRPVQGEDSAFPWPDFRSVADLVRELGEDISIPWIVTNLIAAGDYSLLVGEKGEGKTFFAEALAVHVAAGVPFAGLPVRQGRVLLLLEEDSEQECVDRLRALAAGLGRDLGGLPIRVLAMAGVQLDTDDARDWFRAQLAKYRPVMVAVDSLSAVHSGEENSPKETTAVLKPLRAAAHSAGTALLVLHHPTKTEKGSKLHKVRGAGPIATLARMILWLDRKRDDWVVEAVRHNYRRGPRCGREGARVFHVTDPAGELVRIWSDASAPEPERAVQPPPAVELDALVATVAAKPGCVTGEIATAMGWRTRGRGAQRVREGLKYLDSIGRVVRRTNAVNGVRREEWFVAGDGGDGGPDRTTVVPTVVR